MPDFSDPKYASYGQLCGELRLPHEFRVGDWIARGFGVAVWLDPAFDPPMAGDPKWVGCWLPTLADWLEKLEEEGVRHVEFDPGIDDWHCISIDLGVVGTANTREEAAARVWMEVRSLDRTPRPSRSRPRLA